MTKRKGVIPAITPEKVKLAIRDLLKAAFPDMEVYVDLLPAEPTRPALLIEPLEITTRDISRSTIEEVCKTAVTCPVDPNAQVSGNNDPAYVYAKVRELLRDGTISVEDRAVRCSTQTKKEEGQTRQEVTSTYWETRRETPPQPPMHDINIRKREDSYGTTKRKH